jgi:two-component system sensor histidine kinase KdpD
MRRLSWNLGRLPRGRAIGLVTGVVLALLATLLGVGLELGHFGPPSLYLLAVVVAGALGGVWSGLGTATLSLVGLNYYFTPPVHTLRVKESGDLIALIVFLAVAAVVGSLLAATIEERQRAERRENDLRLLNRLATSLLRADLDGSAIRDVCSSLLEAMRLRRCEVRVSGFPALSTEVALLAGTGSAPNGSRSIDVRIARGDTRLGVLVAERDGDEPFTHGDRGLLEAVAGQLGLAIERDRSSSEARSARMGAEVSDLRAALFSSVTHDLRTPLASIKAGITSLQDEDISLDADARRDLLSTVREETDRLNRLVDNLLNLARARAGDVALEKELTPFEDVVETVLARLRNLLSAFSVRAMIRPDLPGVWIDPVKMDQALTNVIENAAHHSRPGGEIQIAVAPWHRGLQVRVADRGPGIPEEERDLVFEPFFRGSGRTGAGSGLGLAIARAVVQAHGGHIRAEGAPGGGTAIVIDLPEGSPGEAGP